MLNLTKNTNKRIVYDFNHYIIKNTPLISELQNEEE